MVAPLNLFVGLASGTPVRTQWDLVIIKPFWVVLFYEGTVVL